MSRYHTIQYITIEETVKWSYMGMSYHSDLAVLASCGNRYPSNVLTARASKVLSSDNLKHLDLMSPTAGPPEYVL